MNSESTFFESFGSENYTGLRWDCITLVRLPPTEDDPFRVKASLEARRQKGHGISSHEPVYRSTSEWPGRTPFAANGAVGCLLLAVIGDVINWDAFFMEPSMVLADTSLLIEDENRLHETPLVRAAQKGLGKSLRNEAAKSTRFILRHAFGKFGLPLHRFSPRSLRIGHAEGVLHAMLRTCPDEQVITKDEVCAVIKSSGAWASGVCMFYMRNVMNALHGRIKSGDGILRCKDWRKALYMSSARARLHGGYLPVTTPKKELEGKTTQAKRTILGVLNTTEWESVQPDTGYDKIDSELESQKLDVWSMAIQARKFIHDRLPPFESILCYYYLNIEGPFQCPIVLSGGKQCDARIETTIASYIHLATFHAGYTSDHHNIRFRCPCSKEKDFTYEGIRSHSRRNHKKPGVISKSTIKWMFTFMHERDSVDVHERDSVDVDYGEKFDSLVHPGEGEDFDDEEECGSATCSMNATVTNVLQGSPDRVSTTNAGTQELVPVATSSMPDIQRYDENSFRADASHDGHRDVTWDPWDDEEDSEDDEGYIPLHC